MWKKTESTDVVSSQPDPPQPRPSEPVRPPVQAATIGPSIAIKGDISGEEDLFIEGRVEGSIKLRQHNVTVGTSGRVSADIHGKRICIEGQVKGDLLGEEVTIRKSGRVEGNAKAPRVTLENGCNFRGSIDMKPSTSEASDRGKVRAEPRSAARAVG